MINLKNYDVTYQAFCDIFHVNEIKSLTLSEGVYYFKLLLVKNISSPANFFDNNTFYRVKMLNLTHVID